MPMNIIVGAQWGDEGKGHITDLMAADSQIVARYAGGDNAGHTVTVQSRIFKLHLIPSGIIQEQTICILGNGMVINPAVLIGEMDELARNGVDVSPNRLKVSLSAHLITRAHLALDKAKEKSLGRSAIGTTMRGIGPAYTDKAARSGLRTGLLAHPEALKNHLAEHIAEKNRTLTELFAEEPLSLDEFLVEFDGYSKRLKPYLADTGLIINAALTSGDTVLAEGSQGTLLDLDHGTYPFVTSSWPTSGGALIGLGTGPKSTNRIIGVAKAFTSRVGGGPFPTELTNETARHLRGTGSNPWDEFGTTTGRPRRVGWLDIVLLRYATRINGFTELAVTKLDILSGFSIIPVCTAYKVDGQIRTELPLERVALAACAPQYERLSGWETDITHCRRISDLPRNAHRYIEFIEDSLCIPVRYISVGPGREQIIRRD